MSNTFNRVWIGVLSGILALHTSGLERWIWTICVLIWFINAFLYWRDNRGAAF